MRQFLRITATFAFMLVFTASMAFGQKVVNEQSGGSTADIEQTIPSPYANPHTVFGTGGPTVNGSTESGFTQQQGSALEVTQVSGSGGVRSQLVGEQFAGTNEMYVQQRFGANFARIVQRGGGGNLVKLRQKGGGGDGAIARFVQNGNNNTITGFDGSNNMLDGGITVWTGDTHAGNGNGLYSASQKKNDIAVVRQSGDMNTAQFAQEGGNVLRLQQNNGSSAQLYQNGTGNRFAAAPSGSGRFVQESSSLYATQMGDNNMITGGQNVPGSTAFLSQTGNDNSMVINSTVF